MADYQTGLQVVEVYQRHLDTGRNVGQSLVIPGSPPREIPAVRLATTQTDSVAWQVSPDGGTSWQDVTPGGGWAEFAAPESTVTWRSTHFRAAAMLQLEWLSEAAESDSIMDVPGDQGGWVRTYFTRSGYDFASASTPITSYSIGTARTACCRGCARASKVSVDAVSASSGRNNRTAFVVLLLLEGFGAVYLAPHCAI